MPRGIKCNLTCVTGKSDIDRFRAQYAGLAETCRLTGGPERPIAEAVRLGASYRLQAEGPSRLVFYDRNYRRLHRKARRLKQIRIT